MKGCTMVFGTAVRALVASGRISLVAAALLGGPLQAQQPATAADGRALYVANGCYQCHGYEGQGGEVVRIAPSPYPFEAFAQFVRRPSLEMPAYSPNVLSDEDLQRIYAYVRSIPEPPPLADLPLLRDN